MYHNSIKPPVPRYLFGGLGVILFLAGTMVVSADDVCRVVLLGGSSVRTSYLPEDVQHQVLLKEALKAGYPGAEVEVQNWADNGEFIARYLLKGAYEKQRQKQPGVDIAILRFGINDQKRVKPAEYEKQLRQMISLLLEDFPGVVVCLETGIYIDYPAHYRSDRNRSLSPYWEVARKVAEEMNLPLIDYFYAGKMAAEAGQWDIRARRGLVLDASQDAGKEGNVDWFSNIHPNLAGVKMAVEEEVKVIQSRFPERLPVGQKARRREPLEEAQYSKKLGFSSDRLQSKSGRNPEQELQEPTLP